MFLSFSFEEQRWDFPIPDLSVAAEDRLQLPLIMAGAEIDVNVDSPSFLVLGACTIA